MTEQARKVLALVDALNRAFASHTEVHAVQRLMNGIENATRTGSEVRKISPHVPAHLEAEFTQVVDDIPQALGEVSKALTAAAPFLAWKADDASGNGYYEGGADVGRSYSEGNMCCPLVGPANSFIESNEVLLVLFFLKPRTLYRDHVHSASEIYLNLTGPHGFRLGDADWADYAAGSVIWNKPWAAHATRVYSRPFLAAVSWVSDINCTIKVTPREDWAQLEAQLLQS